MTVDGVTVVGWLAVMVVNAELLELMLSSKPGKSKSTFQPTCITKHFVIITKVQKVKSTYEPSGTSGQSLSRFLEHGACSRSISIYMYMYYPWKGYLRVPIYTPRWREVLRALSVLPKNTAQCRWPALVPRPLDPEMSTLTIRPLRLPF